MLRITLSIVVFLIGLLGGLQIAQAQQGSAGFLQITTANKTLLADSPFVQVQPINFQIFTYEAAQICFVGDVVAAQNVVSAILNVASPYGHVLPGRVDLGIDSIQQQFRYERVGSYYRVVVKIDRCKKV